MRNKLHKSDEITAVTAGDGSVTYKNEMISKAFADYFASVFTCDDGTLPDFVVNNVSHFLYNVDISEEAILAAIARLKNRANLTPMVFLRCS